MLDKQLPIREVPQQIAQEKDKVLLQNNEEKVRLNNDKKCLLENLNICLLKIESSNKSINKIKTCSELYILINKFIIYNKGIPKWFFVLLDIIQKKMFEFEKVICSNHTENFFCILYL
jgi:hypothetical protein